MARRLRLLRANVSPFSLTRTAESHKQGVVSDEGNDGRAGCGSGKIPLIEGQKRQLSL